MTLEEALAQLMRVHYGHFMANPEFWKDKDLRSADSLIVTAASDLRNPDGRCMLALALARL